MNFSASPSGSALSCISSRQKLGFTRRCRSRKPLALEYLKKLLRTADFISDYRVMKGRALSEMHTLLIFPLISYSVMVQFYLGNSTQPRFACLFQFLGFISRVAPRGVVLVNHLES